VVRYVTGQKDGGRRPLVTRAVLNVNNLDPDQYLTFIPYRNGIMNQISLPHDAILIFLFFSTKSSPSGEGKMFRRFR